MRKKLERGKIINISSIGGANGESPIRILFYFEICSGGIWRSIGFRGSSVPYKGLGEWNREISTPDLLITGISPNRQD